MTPTDLFSKFIHDARSLQNETGGAFSGGDKETYAKLETLVSHLNALLKQARRSKEERVKSIIGSSWKVISSIGTEVGLFNHYKGNQEFKATLWEFLSEL